MVAENVVLNHRGPAWTPDGSRLVYVDRDDDSYNPQLADLQTKLKAGWKKSSPPANAGMAPAPERFEWAKLLAGSSRKPEYDPTTCHIS